MTLRDAGKSLVSIILILIAISFVEGLFNHSVAPTATPQALATTDKNAFVSGCKGQNSSEEYCGCVYDKLVKLYPDFSTNQDRIHRILTTGYNSAETDLMVACNPPTLTN